MRLVLDGQIGVHLYIEARHRRTREETVQSHEGDNGGRVARREPQAQNEVSTEPGGRYEDFETAANRHVSIRA